MPSELRYFVKRINTRKKEASLSPKPATSGSEMEKPLRFVPREPTPAADPVFELPRLLDNTS
jgi:hypothetical protein